MKPLRTIISPRLSDRKITHHDTILMLGSCFTNNIGARLASDRMDVSYNPFGTLFHPNAILNLMERALGNRPFEASDFFQSHGLWRHWELNATFSQPELNPLVDRANLQLDNLHDAIHKADWAIITLGTAWVYRHIETEKLVANCHKISASSFVKECLTVTSVKRILNDMVKTIQTVNPKAKILFTLSPVRHWKDGAVQNSQSKAILRAAISELSEADYFPAFEIMMDDLRDYRFYTEDMLHPSQQAIDYIYELFGQTFFTEKTQDLNKKIARIQRDMNHRPVHSQTLEYQQFSQKTKKEWDSLVAENPFLAGRGVE